MNTQKVIRRRRSLPHTNVDIDFWAYYAKLDREIKADFAFDIMNATGWGKSTFYTRLRQGRNWLQSEYKAVKKIYEFYKSQFPYDYAG